MEDIIKELAPAETPVAIESIPAPIPDIVEPVSYTHLTLPTNREV
mgnify:CR=1 FL=1